jgi:hypothetical protein
MGQGALQQSFVAEYEAAGLFEASRGLQRDAGA